MPSCAACKPMPVLTERLLIEQPVNTRNASGQPIATWTTLQDNVAGQVIYRRGREEPRGGVQMTATGTHEVTIRYRTDITAKMRITIKRTGEILYVVSYGNREQVPRFLSLECRQELSA